VRACVRAASRITDVPRACMLAHVCACVRVCLRAITVTRHVSK
jgi:hypothetical protein